MPENASPILAQPQRLAAIDASDLLGLEVIPALDRVVRAAAQLLDVPVAQLNIVTADQQIPVSHVGSEAWGRPVGLERSYCQHAVAGGAPLVVEDAREHPVVADSLATRESGIVGYLSIPLLSPRAEYPIGTLCVVDFRPRPWSEREVTVLTELAGWALSEIELRAAQREIQRQADAAVRASDALRRESEDRYRAVVEQGAAALAILEGPDHRFTLVSPIYERWAGVGPLTGRPFLDALPYLRGSPFDRAHEEVFRTGQPLTVHEAEAEADRDGDGVPERYVFTVHYTPLRDAAGRVYAITCLVEDHTEQVRTRRELELAREAAEAANRAKSDFLATMSHELRTPLNAIGGYAELMEMGLRGPLTELQRDDLHRIQQSQRHLLGLINEVLNYARLETGSVRFEQVAVPVHEAVIAAQSLVAPQARGKGLRMETGDGPPGVCALADPEKVRQVLVNLLGNAVKFTPEGGRIDVSYAAVGDQVEIRVRDTGIGIPADRLEGIFEPFVQVRSDLTRTAEGTGLGLAISRDLARAMGGDLRAESELGRGSTFIVTLPAG